MIETATVLPDKYIYIENKYDRYVIVFSSKRVQNHYLKVLYVRGKPRNGMYTQTRFKDIILEDIGVSDDD